MEPSPLPLEYHSPPAPATVTPVPRGPSPDDLFCQSVVPVPPEILSADATLAADIDELLDELRAMVYVPLSNSIDPELLPYFEDAEGRVREILDSFVVCREDKSLELLEHRSCSSLRLGYFESSLEPAQYSPPGPVHLGPTTSVAALSGEMRKVFASSPAIGTECGSIFSPAPSDPRILATMGSYFSGLSLSLETGPRDKGLSPGNPTLFLTADLQAVSPLALSREHHPPPTRSSQIDYGRGPPPSDSTATLFAPTLPPDRSTWGRPPELLRNQRKISVHFSSVEPRWCPTRPNPVPFWREIIGFLLEESFGKSNRRQHPFDEAPPPASPHSLWQPKPIPSQWSTNHADATPRSSGIPFGGPPRSSSPNSAHAAEIAGPPSVSSDSQGGFHVHVKPPLHPKLNSATRFGKLLSEATHPSKWLHRMAWRVPWVLSILSPPNFTLYFGGPHFQVAYFASFAYHDSPPGMDPRSSSSRFSGYDDINSIHVTSHDQFIKLRNLRSRPIVPTRFSDPSALRALGLIAGVNQLFDCIGWLPFFRSTAPTYARLTLEFLSSLAVNDWGFSFRAFNSNWSMSFAELSLKLGFHHPDPDEPPDIDWRTPLPDFDAHAEWRRLTREPHYYLNAKSCVVVNPCYRYAHLVLANTVFARLDSTYVTMEELYFLRSMMHNRLYAIHDYPSPGPHWIIRELRSVSLSLSGAICCGGLITLILRTILDLPSDLHPVPGPTSIDLLHLFESSFITHCEDGAYYGERFRYLFGRDRTPFAILPPPDPGRLPVAHTHVP